MGETAYGWQVKYTAPGCQEYISCVSSLASHNMLFRTVACPLLIQVSLDVVVCVSMGPNM